MTSITFFFIFIPIIAVLFLVINFLFAPHNPYQEKDSAFECGFHSFLGQNRTQFSISFFIFALLFLLFDLEILLVYPYVVSAYTNGIYGLMIMLIFFLALTLGFAFELGKNALKIDSRQMLTLISKQNNITTFVSSLSISTAKKVIYALVNKYTYSYFFYTLSFIIILSFISNIITGLGFSTIYLYIILYTYIISKLWSARKELCNIIKKCLFGDVFIFILVLLIDRLVLSCIIYMLFILLALLSTLYIFNVENYIFISGFLVKCSDYIVYAFGRSGISISDLLNSPMPDSSQGNTPQGKPNPGSGSGEIVVDRPDSRDNNNEEGESSNKDVSEERKQGNFTEAQLKSLSTFDTIPDDYKQDFIYKKLHLLHKDLPRSDKFIGETRNQRHLSITERNYMGEYISRKHPAFREKYMRIRAETAAGYKTTNTEKYVWNAPAVNPKNNRPLTKSVFLSAKFRDLFL